MTQSLTQHPIFEQPVEAASPLDLVVPFTTPRLTQAAVNAANRLGANLRARIRIVRVYIVPFPLNLNEPPIPAEFLREQLQHFQSPIPAECEVRLSRDAHAGLTGSLRTGSVVVLATKKRLWKTSNERLAQALRRRGHTVVVVSEETEN